MYDTIYSTAADASTATATAAARPHSPRREVAWKKSNVLSVKLRLKLEQLTVRGVTLVSIKKKEVENASNAKLAAFLIRETPPHVLIVL